MTSPTAAKCDVSVPNPPASPFPSSGGGGSISIATTRDCTWSISADASWVTVSATSGQGERNVPFTVAPNPTPAARSGALVVASQRVPVSQAGAPCRFDLSRAGDTISAAGGSLSFDVSTLSGCSWTASSPVGWIAIQSGQSGSANGTVSLMVAANAGAQRSGQISVGGQTFTVTQTAATAGPPPPPGVTPTPVVVTGQVEEDATGRCPAISFVVDDRTIVTNADTDFKGFKCSDVKRRTTVRVVGVMQPDGSILAVEVRKI
jgi:Putative binding domain, N-terminal/Domain of unknown function (DUF5666)